MPLYTGPRTGTSFLSDQPAPLGRVLSTTAEDALIRSPIGSIYRGAVQNAAEGRYQSEYYREGAELPDVVSAEDARQRIQDEGLDLTVPDEGIRAPALDLLIERKKDERRRQAVLDRAEPGFLNTSARLGVGLGASLLDPLNIAASFIPVVGQARYAAMLARAGGAAGRAGVRAGIGAAEGAVGAAVLEPIIYAQAQREQADYDLTDSLLNVAFGTVMGGGLHVGAGAVGDALSRGRPWWSAKPSETLPSVLNRMDFESREAMLRTAVGQAASGRNIDIMPLARMNPEFERLLTTTSLVGFGSDPRLPARTMMTVGDQTTPLGRTEPGVAAAPDAPATPALDQRVTLPRLNEKGEVRVFQNEADAQRAQRRLAKKQGDAPDVPQVRQRADGTFILERPAEFDFLRNPDGTPRTFKNERQAKRHISTVADLKGRDVQPVAIRQNGRQVYAIAEGATAEDLSAISAMPDEVRIPPREDRSVGSMMEQDRQALRAQGMERIRQAAKEYNDIRNVRLADAEASAYADQRLAEAPTDDTMADLSLEDVQTEVQSLAETLELTDELKAEMADYDALIETAESYGNAVRAAATCGLRRGAA